MDSNKNIKNQLDNFRKTRALNTLKIKKDEMTIELYEKDIYSLTTESQTTKDSIKRWCIHSVTFFCRAMTTIGAGLGGGAGTVIGLIKLNDLLDNIIPESVVIISPFIDFGISAGLTAFGLYKCDQRYDQKIEDIADNIEDIENQIELLNIKIEN